MKRGYAGGHLCDHLEEYVDGTMSRSQAQRAARHVLVCGPCRDDVEAERAIVQRMRQVNVDPGRQANLMAGLLAMAPPAENVMSAQAHDFGAVRVVSPSAPAQYDRSGRNPVVALVTVGVGCAGLIMALSVAPHRTAPGEGLLDQTPSGTKVVDTFSAPHVSPTQHPALAWLGRPAHSALPKSESSGTIGP